MMRTSPLLAAMLLGGCATNFDPAPPPTGENALIYVVRSDQYTDATTAGPVHIYIDGRKALDLAPSTYSFVYVANGPHKIGMSFGNDNGSDHSVGRSIALDAGQTYYMTCGTFAVPGGSVDYTLSYGCDPADAHNARGYIARNRSHRMTS